MRTQLITNTKTLFAALLNDLETDFVADVGSRDGDQALLFRDLRPEATVWAFEANPINYRTMMARTTLSERGVQIFPYAVTNANGTMQFYVVDVDYSDPQANKGISSLLLSETARIKETVQVDCRRLDELVLERCPTARRIGLWIDVEGAEFGVLEGIAKISERVLAVHVETAEVPLRVGQRVLPDLVSLMDRFGFVLCGTNIRNAVKCGDVVFVQKKAAESLGLRFALCKWKGYVSFWFPVDNLAVFLKNHFPALYRFSRRIYLKIAT